MRLNVERKYTKKKYGRFDAKQRAWFRRYENATGIEPVIISDDATFAAIAKWNIDWYEQHSAEALNKITRDVPE